MATYTYKITTVGTAGSATGTITTEPVSGWIEAVQLDYNASAPATTNVVITESRGMERAILTRNDTATDGIFYLAEQLDGITGVALPQYTKLDFDFMRFTIAVTDSDALAPAVTVRIQTSEA